MGIDLSVAMNVYSGLSENLIRASNIGVLCVSRLDFQKDYDLFEKIEDLDSKEVDFRVIWYNDEGVETITTNPYGDKLTYVLAKEFKNIDQQEMYSDWNNAILGFLQSIPEDTVVILYWS